MAPTLQATLGLLGGALLASATASAAELPALQFSLKPRLCVLTQQEEACYDELEVRWYAPRTMNLCLFQSNLEHPLRCWTDASEGEHRFVLSVTHNVTFELRGANQSTLVSEAFEVIHDHKKYRRQRRNPWSFF